MEYVQERITTLHDITDPSPSGPLEDVAVVIPMTAREYGSLATERTLSAVAAVEPATVVVPLRVPADRVGPFSEWLAEFDVPVEVCWCNGPAIATLLDRHRLDGAGGKGRDVWLALGLAAQRAEYVACIDGDATTFSRDHLPRLISPLADHDFCKAYYARVENGRLYGRLFRLLYAPLIRTLVDRHSEPILEYLSSFRYPLAGEFAAASPLIRQLRVQRGWGFEVGTLGDIFPAAGFADTAQVDLGRHEHDHKAVGGPTGLFEMSTEVGAAIMRTVEEGGVDPEYGDLRERYREVAERLVDQYAADARFNELSYDSQHERSQVTAYAEAVASPGPDRRLPPWTEAPITPEDVRAASATAIESIEDS